MTAFAKNLSTPKDSTITCLTKTETEVFHRIYDGRDECYDHFVRAVTVARYYRKLLEKLGENNKMLEKQLKQHQLDDLTYEEALELSAEDLSKLRSALNKTIRKLNNRNKWLYILGGGLLAETLSIVLLTTI